MSRAIVIMTALVPTIGHEALVRFATHLVGSRQTIVVISGRSFEPVPLWARMLAFENAFPKSAIRAHYDDKAPQTPNGEDPEFWAYWKKAINRCVQGVEIDDIIVTSEPYGAKLAELFGCKFIPFDISREIYDVKGSTVRSDMLGNWHQIMPEFRRQIGKTVTLFGAESCGKTTMTKKLAGIFGAPYSPEWARPYLEMVGPEITEEKMSTIIDGQYASQSVIEHDTSTFFKFRDTDLLSTLGYYRIWGRPVPNKLLGMTTYATSSFYIVMPDGIPFEPDPLRYGGDKRESDTQFWLSILDEFHCNYHVVKNTDRVKQLCEIIDVLFAYREKFFEPIQSFVREE